MMIDKIYKYILKHWKLNCLLTIGPSVYFVLVKVVGKQLGLVNSQGNLSIVGNILFWLFVSFVIIYGIFKSWSECDMYHKIEDSQEILQDVVSSTNSVCDKKFQNLMNYIEKNTNKNNVRNIIFDIIKPSYQIDDLLKELDICLSRITGIKRDNIGISIFQKFAFQDDWECNYSKNISNCNINNIINSSQSAVRQIIDENTDMIFTDKEDAIKVSQYIPSSKDKCYDNEGSIICISLFIKIHGNEYIKGVLNISTYGEKICDKDDKDTKDKIIDIVIKPFILRIKMELCYEYIRKLYEKSINRKKYVNKNSKVIPYNKETASQAAAITKSD